MADTKHTNGFEPKIVAFFCNWCTYLAADLAGTSRLKYPPNVRVIRLMCSGRVDPQFVLEAFAHGADGVLIGGCHPGDCHYQEGNYKALRRFHLLKRILQDMGIEECVVFGPRDVHLSPGGGKGFVAQALPLQGGRNFFFREPLVDGLPEVMEHELA